MRVQTVPSTNWSFLQESSTPSAFKPYIHPFQGISLPVSIAHPQEEDKSFRLRAIRAHAYVVGHNTINQNKSPKFCMLFVFLQIEKNGNEKTNRLSLGLPECVIQTSWWPKWFWGWKEHAKTRQTRMWVFVWCTTTMQKLSSSEFCGEKLVMRGRKKKAENLAQHICQCHRIY